MCPAVLDHPAHLSDLSSLDPLWVVKDPFCVYIPSYDSVNPVLSLIHENITFEYYRCNKPCIFPGKNGKA